MHNLTQLEKKKFKFIHKYLYDALNKIGENYICFVKYENLKIENM